ncbi:MAG: MFS transporter [Steroidobacteraceae bacterium]
MVSRPTTVDAAARGGIPVRWKIYSLTFVFGAFAYLQQRTLTVTAYQMMPQLGLSQMQIGWLEWAFLIGYTAMQSPGGIFGQRFGARASFTAISVLAFAAMMLTPLAPYALHGLPLFSALIALQVALGVAQGPIFPVCAGVFKTWFAPQSWPFVQGLQSMGLQLGAAVTPPLIAWLMGLLGWQQAIVWTTLPFLLLIGLWAWYARDVPAEHPGVRAEELAELGEHARARVDARITWRRVAALLKDRDLLALTLSYVCMNYVFYLVANWVFLYLVQDRHLTTLESGWLAAIPPMASALAAGTGGWVASALVKRRGTRWGLHIVPLLSLPAAGLLLIGAGQANEAYVAVGALALCFALVEVNEGCYWAAAMHLGEADTMTATGILNTGGNAGGLIAIPIVAYLSEHHAWRSAFMLGFAFAVASGALWLLVNPTRRLGNEPQAPEPRAEGLEHVE